MNMIIITIIAMIMMMIILVTLAEGTLIIILTILMILMLNMNINHYGYYDCQVMMSFVTVILKMINISIRNFASLLLIKLLLRNSLVVSQRWKWILRVRNDIILVGEELISLYSNMWLQVTQSTASRLKLPYATHDNAFKYGIPPPGAKQLHNRHRYRVLRIIYIHPKCPDLVIAWSWLYTLRQMTRIIYIYLYIDTECSGLSRFMPHALTWIQRDHDYID